MSARRRRAPADEGDCWPPSMCPHCGGAITTGQRVEPFFRIVRYDAPRPHPVLSHPITIRGIIANGTSRTDLSVHEQLKQRAAMGGETEPVQLQAFEDLFVGVLSQALVSELSGQS